MTSDNKQTTKIPQRIYELDGVRGIAIFLVLLHHHCQHVRPILDIDRDILAFTNSTWIGVDLFFVLSGFLITGILIDAKGSPTYFWTFYIRRALRIFPIYYLMLVFLFFVTPSLDANYIGYSRGSEPWFFFYGSNYLTGSYGWPARPLSHLWSLAIEEHFYMLWPFIVALSRLKWLATATFVCILGFPFLREYSLNHGGNLTAIFTFSHFRIDTLLTGSLLAVVTRLYPTHQRIIGQFGLVLATISILISYFWLRTPLGLDWTHWKPHQLSWGFSLVALAFCGGMAALLGQNQDSLTRRFLRWKPLVRLGSLSYAIYLFHLPLEAWARDLGLHPNFHAYPGRSIVPYMAFYVIGNGMLAYWMALLSWKFIEGPILKLKNRWQFETKR